MVPAMTLLLLVVSTMPTQRRRLNHPAAALLVRRHASSPSDKHLLFGLAFVVQENVILKVVPSSALLLLRLGRPLTTPEPRPHA
jgi:hypothetical protein